MDKKRARKEFSAAIMNRLIELDGETGKRVSVTDLADRMQCPQPLVSKWMAGKGLPGSQYIGGVAREIPEIYGIMEIELQKENVDTLEKFSEWLKKEIEERGWDQAELARQTARRGHPISTSQISRVLNSQASPGRDFCIGIAAALGQNPEDMMRLASLLPKRKALTRWSDEMRLLIDELESPGRRRVAYEVLKSLVLSERDERGHTLDAPDGPADHERHA